MQDKQRIEILTTLLAELSDFDLDLIENMIIAYTPAERYYEVFEEIDGKWKRMERMEGYVKEFAERVKTAREMTSDEASLTYYSEGM